MTLMGSLTKVACVATASILLGVATPPALAFDTNATQDVIRTVDGRELRGEIVSETETEIVFKITDAALGLSTTLTFQKADLEEVLRDVAPESEATEKKASSAPPASSFNRAAASNREGGAKDGEAFSFGSFGRDDDNPNLPSVYVVPMKGQAGTDINSEVYSEVVEDIKRVRPDYIVVHMDCKFMEEMLLPTNVNEAMKENDLFLHGDFRELVDLFSDDLRNVPQVIWVEDAFGYSALIAMSFERMFMTPRARLAGLGQIYGRIAGWSDPDVRAKMAAAWTGIANSFLENGRRSPKLGEAMMVPRHLLSASFVGRSVEWYLDDSGEYVVDASDEAVVGFNASVAEKLCISEGTVETLDDLIFMMGLREYRMVGDEGREIIEDYVESWRRTYAQCETLIRDITQWQGWATGEDTLKYTAKELKAWETILAAMRRYDAVETRLGAEYGLSILGLEILIDQLRERIQQLRRQDGGGGGRGRGGGSGGGGLGGGGR